VGTREEYERRADASKGPRRMAPVRNVGVNFVCLFARTGLALALVFVVERMHARGKYERRTDAGTSAVGARPG